MRRLITVILIIAAAQFLGGCAVLEYYRQSAVGHLQLMTSSRPITDWLGDERTPDGVRSKLQTVLVMRHFATSELLLPDNGSYLDYADLGRPYVVWNVFATPEFSLKPVQSCFPVVGCLDYRGYFSKDDAEEQARQLADTGHDVHLGGVAAYSTLGWFADPMLNTMLRWDEPRLAAVLFHELAHQKVYAEDDSAYNEAFATAVGLIGVERWLAQQGDAAELKAWQQSRQYQADFLTLVEATLPELESLYSSDLSIDDKRQAKTRIFAALRTRHQQLKATAWQGYDGYDDWFETVNNARLSAVSTYHRWVPAFMTLLDRVDGDLERFYAECTRAAGLTRAARREWLKDLLKAG